MGWPINSCITLNQGGDEDVGLEDIYHQRENVRTGVLTPQTGRMNPIPTKDEAINLKKEE